MVKVSRKSGGHVIRTRQIQAIDFVFVVVAVCVRFAGRGVNLFARELEDVGEGRQGKGCGRGRGFELFKGDIDSARFVCREFRSRDEKVFFQNGIVFFSWCGDDGDIFEDGVGKRVSNVVLKDDVLFENVLDGCDHVFGFTLGELDD